MGGGGREEEEERSLNVPSQDSGYLLSLAGCGRALGWVGGAAGRRFYTVSFASLSELKLRCREMSRAPRKQAASLLAKSTASCQRK